MRVSYSGQYVTFPRLSAGFDSQYPHHCSILMIYLPIRIMVKKADLLSLTKDRLAILLLFLMLFSAVFVVVMTFLRIHSSDIQVPTRFTGFGQSNIYREQWYAQFSFAGFSLLVLAVNGYLSIKLHTIDRLLGIGFMALSLFLFVVALFIANAIFNLTPTI